MDNKQRSVLRLAATGAVVAGLAAGSYGVASAATGPSTTTPLPPPRRRGSRPALGPATRPC